MDAKLTQLETERLALQERLDAQRPQFERNQLGQFATPSRLARQILQHAVTLLPEGHIRFLDPAVGTGAFVSALYSAFPRSRIREVVGFEIDPHYGLPTKHLWREFAFQLHIADFTRQTPNPHYNLVICNPPYVRHHHLHNGDKSRLQQLTLHASGMKLSGLAGLYCHFLGISHAWMADGGLAGWLIPSEFMDVNYGRAIKRYLLQKVTLIRVHRFDPNDVQFADALVSSAIVWFKKTPPPEEHSVEFTYGGTLVAPARSRTIHIRDLMREPKWTRFPAAENHTERSVSTIADFFQIRRGLATGDNSFFILSEEEIQTRKIPHQVLRPILPSPRHMPADEIEADYKGLPLAGQRLFLIDTRIPEEDLAHRFPALYGYLQEGRQRHVHLKYLCRHRAPWYAQENRPPAPFLCTYLGRTRTKRGRPFRFILNHSQATVTNVYLAMYPKQPLLAALALDPTLARRVWLALNAIPAETLLSEGRVYGGGLHKLEPKELANVDASEIARLVHEVRPFPQAYQLPLLVHSEHDDSSPASQ